MILSNSLMEHVKNHVFFSDPSIPLACGPCSQGFGHIAVPQAHLQDHGTVRSKGGTRLRWLRCACHSLTPTFSLTNPPLKDTGINRGKGEMKVRSRLSKIRYKITGGKY